ncbi:hypothetical protein SAMN05428962_5209 [Paenibacillus sp. BC26]|nr:hypothetical protein SAMN05428962_5209 [Paenibacillus sp. BC26]
MLVVCLLLVSLFSIGCSRGGSSMSEANSTEPPNAYIIVDQVEIPLIKGSYQWKNAIADAPTPDMLVRDSKVYIVNSGSAVTVSFHSGPEPTETWGGLWVNQNFTPLTKQDGKFLLPSEPGQYIFVAGGKWTEGECSYATILKVVE